MNPLLIRNCGNGFPQFTRARIYIEVVWPSKDFTYRLKPSVLTKASPWFANSLKQKIQETKIGAAEKIKQESGCYYKFELSPAEDNTWFLNRVVCSPCLISASICLLLFELFLRHQVYILQPFTLSKEWVPPYLTAQDALPPGPRVTRYFTTHKAKDTVRYAEPSTVPLLLAEAYDNMFRLMHGMTAKFDTENIDNALEQAENLIEVTAYYGCQHLVCHPSLADHFLSFDRVLFVDIMLNAPRWLKLSISLEADSIFREAMIHMVGKYRSSSWKTRPHPKLPVAVWRTIKAKHDKILDLKTYVDEKLVNNPATIYGRSSSPQNTSLQTWLVSNMWHDWVGFAISKTMHANPKVGTYAVMYRLMDAGGNAYLSAASVYEDLKLHEQNGFEHWDLTEIEKELDEMKTFAQAVVHGLCINHSVLNVKEFDIEYMTCCVVVDDDVPWLKSNRHNSAIERYRALGLLPPSQDHRFSDWAFEEE